MYPLATNRALRQSTLPLGPTLIAYTHLQPTAFFLGGKGTNSHVPLCSRACISTIMTCCRSGWSKEDKEETKEKYIRDK